jgi:hypothetical protein
MVNNEYYIYFHMDGDEVVYIGKGIKGRACQLQRKNEEHERFLIEAMLEHKQFYLIVEKNLTEEEALLLEKKLIEEEQPIFNKRFTPEGREQDRNNGLKGAKASMRKVKNPTNVIFNSLTEAALFYSKSVSWVWLKVKNGAWSYV